MKILISGGTGFIGVNLIKSLLKKEYSISVILRKNSDTSKLDKEVSIFIYDGDMEKLENFFVDNNFIGVIHLASLFLPEHSQNDINSLIDSNIKFGTHLLEVSKNTNVKWFLNTGTLWQNYNNEIYNPVNLYAATKEAFINISKYYTETSDLIFTTIKLNDTFGPNDKRKKIFNLWKEIIENNSKLKMSKGEQIIDILFIDDIINAFEILINYLSSKNANNFKNKVYVVNSKERMSLKELATLFEDVSQKKLNILWGDKEYRDREVMIPFEDGELVPNWEQRVSLRDGIIKTIGSY